MDKKLIMELGKENYENTLKVIENLPDDDTMVFGTEELDKQEILTRFKEDPEFAKLVAKQLNYSVKQFLIRKQYGKARGRKKRRKTSKSGS